MAHSIEDLIQLSEVYCNAAGVTKSTLSGKMLKSGARLKNIANGAPFGYYILERAILWLSENWHEKAEWPPNIPRPKVLDANNEENKNG